MFCVCLVAIKLTEAGLNTLEDDAYDSESDGKNMDSMYHVPPITANTASEQSIEAASDNCSSKSAGVIPFALGSNNILDVHHLNLLSQHPLKSDE